MPMVSGLPGWAIKDPAGQRDVSIIMDQCLRDPPPQGVAEKRAGTLSMYRYICNTSTPSVPPFPLKPLRKSSSQQLFYNWNFKKALR